MTNEDRATWLAGLKAGDEVAMELRRSGHQIVTVTRRTGSGRIIVQLGGGEITYNADGIERGKGLGTRIMPVTQEIRDGIERNRSITRVEAVNWRGMDLATLRAVLAIIDAKVSS